ncbi:MAG: hypothetical protein AAFW46_05995 [Pseudomonadota bacterium]
MKKLIAGLFAAAIVLGAAGMAEACPYSSQQTKETKESVGA